MKRYKKYKKTNIEFLDEIPENWIEKRMRFIGYLFGGLSGKSADDFNKEGDENNKHYIPFTNIANNLVVDPDNLQTVIVKKDEKQNKVQNGDLFFLMSSENYDDVGKSAVLCNELPETYLNSFCKGFRVTQDNIISKFLNYQLHSKQHRHNLLTGANGFTRINLKIDKVKDLFVALPPTPEEQTAIANYLDRKTAEIDGLIADKKRLLELYEEEKTAIINQAVTKGINPDVPMKDSGIEWLGEIPEHWEVLPIKYTLSTPITDGPHETPELLPDGIPFISAEAIKNDKIDFSKKRGFISREEHERFSLKYKPQVGDVYMIKSGATTGNLAIVETDIEFNIWSPLAAMRPNFDVLLSEFLFYFMKSKSFFSAIEIGWNYGTQQNIGMKVLENIRMVLPSTNEQKEIVEHIKIHMVQIDSQIDKINRLIDLLTEYRTALISEVVTGKIKVTE